MQSTLFFKGSSHVFHDHAKPPIMIVIFTLSSKCLCPLIYNGCMHVKNKAKIFMINILFL